MSKSFVRLSGLAIMLAMVNLPQRAASCSCDIPSYTEARDRSDVTFAGEALTRTFMPTEPVLSVDYWLIVMRVENCWKGALSTGQRVQVWTPACIGCCGYDMFPGEHHVLFCFGTSPVYFVTSFCVPDTPTHPAVLAALGPPGCNVAVEKMPWHAVKRLYAEP